MTELKKYKYATYILAACVVALAIALYMVKGNDTVSDIYQSLNAKVNDCEDALANWKAKHPTNKALTPAEQAELKSTLEMCTAQLKASQDAI